MPDAVSAGQAEMFAFITFNNIRVSLIAFIAGLFFSFGTAIILFQNGIMLGAFQYFFYEYDLLWKSVLTVWIHGTIEISSIIVAGAAGLVMGNSILFPGTYSRLESFKKGTKNGMKMAIGLIPLFILAGFLEGFVTRHPEMPAFLSMIIIGCSLVLILFYFVYYPAKLNRKFLKNKENTL